MHRAVAIVFGSIWAVGLMVAAMWLWQNAASLAVENDHDSISEWSIRFAAVAAGAAAQLITLAVVNRQIYRRDLPSNLLRAAAALVFTVALISSIVLAAAGK
jgi:hypothetical protein